MSDTILSRRSLLASGAAAGAASLVGALPSDAQSTARNAAPQLGRVIIDNDFSGDPDGLCQLAHHLLCPSLTFPLIIGSHLPKFAGPRSATEAAAKAQAIVDMLKVDGVPKPIAGAEEAIASRASWKPVAATASIVREAMRTDARGPLIYAAGAGLTDLALAWLAEPRIGKRIKLIWIGGHEHPEIGAAPLTPDETEFNFGLDPVAAKIIFNESDIEIWQVPRDVYRQMLFTRAELDDLAEESRIGSVIKGALGGMLEAMRHIPGVPPFPETEAYVLGDSPLVTLTALVGPFNPDASSSKYTVMPTPRFRDNGTYEAAPGGRPMRVYQTIDSGLTFRDMASRFRRWQKRGAAS